MNTTKLLVIILHNAVVMFNVLFCFHQQGFILFSKHITIPHTCATKYTNLSMVYDPCSDYLPFNTVTRYKGTILVFLKIESIELSLGIQSFGPITL